MNRIFGFKNCWIAQVSGHLGSLQLDNSKIKKFENQYRESYSETAHPPPRLSSVTDNVV